MPRPSRNVDAALLEAGRALYPLTGARGLSVRKVVEHAGANLGMFHYHFGSKDAFVRVLLTSMYDAMFAELTLAAGDPRPGEALRSALLVLARFVRDHRRALRRLMMDALDDEPTALEFVRANLPRHVRVILGLVKAGVRSGAFRRLAPMQALAFIGGAIGAPVLLGTALTEHAGAPAALRRSFERATLSDRALAERVDLVLVAVSAPRQGRAR